MANNEALFDALIAGACGGSHQRWITETDPSDYTPDMVAIVDFATEVDAAIPNIPAGPSISQINLLQSIAQGVVGDRDLRTLSNFAPVAAAIFALFTEASIPLFNEPVIPGGGGGGTPLTKEFWVDPGRIGSTEDGSIGNPFLTAQAGVDVLLADDGIGVLQLASGDYTAEALDLGDIVNIALVSAEKSQVVFASIAASSTGTADICLQGITVTGDVTLAHCRAVFQYCSIAGAFNTNVVDCKASFTDFGSINTVSNLDHFELDVCAISDTFMNGPATANCRNTTITGNIADLSILNCWDCILNGDIGITGGREVNQVLLNQTSVAGVVTMHVLGNPFATDSYSLTSLRAGVRVHTIPNLTITDRPLGAGLIYAVPALAAAMEDVTVAFADCEPGDTFVISQEVRLAGVGIVGAWCAVAGQLTLRFFGTTAGGNVTVNANRLNNS